MAVADGRLQIREWTDKYGNKRRAAEVVADNVYFGDSKRDTPIITAPEAMDATDNGFEELSGGDSELPF